jgi:hypothetical protein
MSTGRYQRKAQKLSEAAYDVRMVHKDATFKSLPPLHSTLLCPMLSAA